MKGYVIVLVMLLGAVAYAQRGAGPAAPAGGAAAQEQQGQAQPGGRGRGQGPEQQAAAAAQNQLEQSVPQIPFDAVALPLMPEGHTIGETEGVALNSKKHLFVYRRSGNVGPARGATAAELFEFDQTGKYEGSNGLTMSRASFASAPSFC